MKRTKERELKMVWEVMKGDRRSYLIGTAHFFPYSFRTSLLKLIGTARAILFEGPLDEDSMNKVVRAGSLGEGEESVLLKDLGNRILSEIKGVLIPSCRKRRRLFLFTLREIKVEDPLLGAVSGMKPWMAFFTLWTHFLKQKGWLNSVDLEAYHIAGELGKPITHLEDIEEQIEVLEAISYEKIVDFLKRVRHWDEYAETYARTYLEGDLEGLRSNTIGFPSRHHSVIDRRDEIFYERMKDDLEEGGAVACVGAPHIHGIRDLALKDGYRVRRT